MNREACYWNRMDDKKVKCSLCPHECIIGPGFEGACKARVNLEGKLLTISYGEITSMNKDPIEKKPLYHYYPGSMILSMGSFGCNFKCSFCQNYTLSQSRAASEYYSVDETIQLALEDKDNGGLAFTYNEPTTLYEYVYETFKRIKEKQLPLKTVLVTNGYINPEPLKKLMPYVDAMNIDIKSMDALFYKSICKGTLEPVLATVAMAVAAGVHVEVTTLMVTGHMDKVASIEPIAEYLATLNSGIPLHLSRYFPQYNMGGEPTDPMAMALAKKAAEKYLKYVYLGNLFDEDVSTHCPTCGRGVILRQAYRVKNLLNEKGTCPHCGNQVPYIVMD